MSICLLMGVLHTGGALGLLSEELISVTVCYQAYTKLSVVANTHMLTHAHLTSLFSYPALDFYARRGSSF